MDGFTIINFFDKKKEDGVVALLELLSLSGAFSFNIQSFIRGEYASKDDKILDILLLFLFFVSFLLFFFLETEDVVALFKRLDLFVDLFHFNLSPLPSLNWITELVFSLFRL